MYTIFYVTFARHQASIKSCDYKEITLTSTQHVFLKNLCMQMLEGSYNTHLVTTERLTKTICSPQSGSQKPLCSRRRNPLPNLPRPRDMARIERKVIIISTASNSSLERILSRCYYYIEDQDCKRV